MRLQSTYWIPVALSALLGGCAARTTTAPDRPARINHVVFFKLHDPAGTNELIVDCDAMAAAIPGITSCYTGTHLDIGRETVDGNYDVGFYVGFDSVEAYRAYVEHPAHVDLVARWKPRLESLRVYDVMDED